MSMMNPEKDPVRFCPLCSELFQHTKLIGGNPFIGHFCYVFDPPRQVWWNGISLVVDGPFKSGPCHLDEGGGS